MLVLHGIWDRSSFHLWAESSALPAAVKPSRGRVSKTKPRPHPFAVPKDMLTDEMTAIFGMTPSGAGTIVCRLPATKKGPLPSPGLIRDDRIDEEPSGLSPWFIDALAFDPLSALHTLLDLPVHPPPGIAFAGSLEFWTTAARFALELVAREQFAPVAIDGIARWRPIIDEDDRSRLQTLAKSLPAACLAFEEEISSRRRSQQKCGPDPHHLVTSFIDLTTDAFVRRSLIAEEIRLDPQSASRRSKAAPLPRQFLQALAADDPSLEGPVPELKAFSKKIGSWLSSLKPPFPNAPFRTCFRLDSPPAAEDGEDQPWHIRIFLQAKDDKSLLVPAEEVWKARSQTATFLKRKIKNPQEHLLADLGTASRISPEIERCLMAACPSSLELQTEEAYRFLRGSAPLLEQSGFGVLLPSWWEKRSDRIGLKLKLNLNLGLGVEEGAIDLEDETEPDLQISQVPFGLNSVVEYDWKLALGDSDLTERELRHLIDLKVPLVQVRGEWVELPSGEIEAAIRFFEKRRREGVPETVSLEEAIRLALGAELAMEGDLPVLKVEAEGQIRDMLDRLDGKGRGEIEDVEVPATFRGTLRPYQAKGLSWLSYLHQLRFGACLADDMGLGKTVELIAFLLHQRASQTGRPSLLISPMSVVGNWQRELDRFAPSLRVLVHHGADRLTDDEFANEAKSHDLVITTYATAQRDEEALLTICWQNLVLDEAQNIKNPQAKQTKTAKKLQADQRIALTGTPVENRLLELWSIMDFLNPGYLGPAKKFHETFALPIERYRDRDRAERLRRMTQPFILRRLKTDPAIIKDLPDKVETKVYYHLTSEQATLYGAVVEDMLEKIEYSADIQRRGLILAALTKLKQICNHPALFLQDGSALEGRSGKLTRLEEMVEEVLASEDKALIFTQFAGMGTMLKHHLQEKVGCEVLFLQGKTPKLQRDAMVERFQSDGAGPPLFILSLKAGGFGLNLTAASRVFHFDRWWNPAVENQATDRAFRIGQQKNVFVHKFVCMGTLEDRIDKMIEEKKELAEAVVGAGEAWLTQLSTEDLRQVLALSREAIEGDDR
ncbi:DEAD/DEAH box helicase [Candidatus Methanocrinis natronophilus]|uniref:DEAD/DEAH box helicase n=1 Tax=Candidatus Methanocrinis natronophilus TaxID=3033396 RepID=A0ABT5XAX8_9EURY|nr:DEAD/DEAH box helicase [Candidatus Methanocrinis natronophilus]MDF0591835.1 DEAD/DEAH box helicase [Candidatus Methanocrinis natronophilus]